MSTQIAAVVIVVPAHERFLPSLISNLNLAEPRFDQVVIVASGFGGNHRSLLDTARGILSKQVLVHFRPLGSAGANRNAGWEFSSGDFTCFLDADDLYAPERNTVIRRLHEEIGFDLFLHGFSSFDSSSEASVGFSASSEVQGRELVSSSGLTPRANRNRVEELRGNTDSTNIQFAEGTSRFEVHHAHAVVNNRLRGKAAFHEVFGVRNEDGVFAQDLLESGCDVLLSPAILSAYRQGARAKPRKKTPLPRIIRRVRSALGVETTMSYQVFREGPPVRIGGSRPKSPELPPNFGLDL